MIFIETWRFPKGNLDRLSLAIQTSPVFGPAHMVDLEVSDMMIFIETWRFYKGDFDCISFAVRGPPVFKLAHMIDLGFSRSRGFHHFWRYMLNVLPPYERAQRLGVSRNRKIARKMKKSYEISIVFALGKVDVLLNLMHFLSKFRSQTQDLGEIYDLPMRKSKISSIFCKKWFFENRDFWVVFLNENNRERVVVRSRLREQLGFFWKKFSSWGMLWKDKQETFELRKASRAG